MPTPLYPIFEKRVADAVEQLLQKQVTPWAFLSSGKPFQVSKFDGRKIVYQGGEFEGSRREVFWGRYIEPFLEDLSVREIDAAVKMADERGVDAKLLLSEVQSLLVKSTRKVFDRMAEIDRRLIGKGYPNNVPLRSVENEVRGMAQFIEKRIAAEIAMLKRQPRRKGSSQVINIQNLQIGDSYNAAQVGAMGPNAKASEMAFHLVESQQLNQINIHVLADELATLRRRMSADSVPNEAIEQIAAAEKAARSGNQEGVMRHLKAAGKQALEVAKEIGVNLVSEAIGKALQ
jgi:hypothetical protein